MTVFVGSLSEVPFPHGLWPNCMTPPPIADGGWMELALHYAWPLHPAGLSKSLISASIKDRLPALCQIWQSTPDFYSEVDIGDFSEKGLKNCHMDCHEI